MRRRRGCSTGLAIISPSRRGTEPTLKKVPICHSVTSHTMDPRQVTLPSTWLSSTPSMILGKRSTIRGVLSSMISLSLRAGGLVAIWILHRRIPAACFVTTGCRDQHDRRLFLGSSRNGILLRASGWFLVNAAPGPLELNLCSDGPRWTSDISCFARHYSTAFSASQRLVHALSALDVL